MIELANKLKERTKFHVNNDYDRKMAIKKLMIKRLEENKVIDSDIVIN